MKKHVMGLGVAVVMISALVLPVSHAQADTNLVANGTFETATAGNAGKPLGWSSDYWGSLTGMFTYPVAGQGGGVAAQVKLTKYSSGDARWYFDYIPVTPGTTYQYADSYTASVVTNVTAVFLMSNGSYTYLWLGNPAASATVWTTFTGSVKAPAGAVSMTIIHVIKKVGTLTIDNVSVTAPGAVPPPPVIAKPVISSFTASPASILVGSSTTLSWSVSQASSTSLNQTIDTVVGTSQSVSPIQTTVYVLTATNPGGSSYATTTVTVTTPAPPRPPPAATCTLTANPTSMLLGSSTMLTFTSQNATAGSINNGVGAVATSGTKAVSPATTTLYTGTFTGAGASGTCSAQVTVTTPVPPAPTSTPVTNLINNGNLETGTTNDPTGWTSDDWGSMTVKFTYPVFGHGGGKAAQVQVTKYSSGDAKWYFDHVPVSSHTIYTFSDDYNSTVVNNVSVEFLMSDGTYTYQWIADAPATGGAWQTLTAQATVPTGAVSMTVLHTLQSVGTLTIDNASLVAQPANPFPSPMLTFTLDDGELSQYQNALPILIAAGMKASFYIITSEPGSGDSGYMSWAQIKDLATKGFEVGGHTRTHPYLTQLTTAQAQAEIAGSFTDLVAQGFSPKTFVYPYGDRNSATDAMVKAAGYVGSRGSYYGLETPLTPRYNLDDIRVDSTTSLASIEAKIQQAVADKRWIVLEIHDVLQSGGDTYSVTPAFFQSLVNYVKSSGSKVVTLEEGESLMN